jgi:probable HAF family extracellular repeat protein
MIRLVSVLGFVTLAALLLSPQQASSGVAGILCSAGTVSQSGFKPCTPCQPGTFAAFEGSDHCDACPATSYAPDPGAAACTPCGCDDGLVCTVENCGAASGICFGTPDPSCRVSFRGLGFLPGSNWSTANDVSSDGEVVVGWSQVGAYLQAYRWTRAEGMVPLGDLPGGDPFSEAWAVSGDGSLVVGVSDGDVTLPFGGQAFTWTDATGIHAIPGSTPTGASSALGVSDDGSTIVGWHYFTSSATAFRFTSTMTELAGLTVATDASADGSFVVGYDMTQAKRWSGAGIDVIGRLGTDNHSEARAVTPDGQTVVGWSFKTSSSFDGSEPFRWTPDGGLVGLGYRSGRVNLANDVSASGKLIVGTVESGGTTDYRAFVWTEQEGVRQVRDLLAEYGATTPGWTLYEATGVSADGATIVGNGSGPSGQQAWIATIPEPAPQHAAVAAALVLACLACVAPRPAPRT